MPFLLSGQAKEKIGAEYESTPVILSDHTLPSFHTSRYA